MKVSQRRKKWRKKLAPYIANAFVGGIPSAGAAYFSGRLARDPHRLKHAAIWGLGGAIGSMAGYHAFRPRKRK